MGGVLVENGRFSMRGRNVGNASIREGCVGFSLAHASIVQLIRREAACCVRADGAPSASSTGVG
jgi:hypothetical protein